MSPAKDDNAAWRKANRKDCLLLMGVQYDTLYSAADDILCFARILFLLLSPLLPREQVVVVQEVQDRGCGNCQQHVNGPKKVAKDDH